MAYTDVAMLRWLKQRNEGFHSKALEVREAASRWLGYIPQSFQHYTTHGIDHSDEIILQISKLLFKDDDPAQAVVKALSPTEGFILVVAAYLHDSGMVASDREKQEILGSDSWRKWVQTDAARERWTAVEQFRANQTPPDSGVRNFIADLQVRFLIAEFIRNRHHERAASVIAAHQSALGRFAFDQPDLARAIADVCVAHGLSQQDLLDSYRYPEERDVFGEKVNMRFLATVLRLGDLLDMRHDRACPLLLNAACPLPADSYAHWTQYQRIVDRLTSPETIRIRAECLNANEHRVLSDWCKWLVNEVDHARRNMARARRHSDWVPPLASMAGEQPTIEIRPAPEANYLPRNWVFELDPEAVLERLVRDVYDTPNSFVRELIQNALDATRCRMYADMEGAGEELPVSPVRAAERWRDKYPLRVALRVTEGKNELSGIREPRQVLTVDDQGIGMDEAVIQGYLLQVGRSWYRTEEFRRKYSFAPTSHFGIGFLSVFAASDHVVVETRGQDQGQAVRMLLTGPRNYLLTEKGDRREPLQEGALTQLVRGWCKKVEFPVLVDDCGRHTTIRAESAQEYVQSVESESELGTRYEIRSFPIERPGIEGELYVFTCLTARREQWDYSRSKRQWLRERHPTERVPEPPGYLVCFNGIGVSQTEAAWSGTTSTRIDYRGSDGQLGASRASWRRVPRQDLVESRWEELIRSHLDRTGQSWGRELWKYKQRLAKQYELGEFWAREAGMIPIYRDGALRPASLADVEALASVWLLTKAGVGPLAFAKKGVVVGVSGGGILAPLVKGISLRDQDMESLCSQHKDRVLTRRGVGKTKWVGDGALAIEWRVDNYPATVILNKRMLESVALAREAHVSRLPNRTLVGLRVKVGEYDNAVLLNSGNRFANWFLGVWKNHADGQHAEMVRRLAIEIVTACMRPFQDQVDELREFMKRWRTLPEVPPALKAVDYRLTPESFAGIPNIRGVLRRHGRR
jgi:hypothetical protein